MARETDLTQIADELTAIKRLLIVALLQNGMSQRDVATALGVNQSSVSRMFNNGSVPNRLTRPARRTSVAEQADE